jgi:hypothetical protein
VPDPQRQHVRAKRVLLLDDTLTTGARAQSAAAALVRAGAAAVVIVVIGRVVRPEASAQSAVYWRHAAELPYRLERCCVAGCVADPASAFPAHRSGARSFAGPARSSVLRRDPSHPPGPEVVERLL